MAPFAVIQDIFEPMEITRVLSTSITVHRQYLVSLGLADYYWDSGVKDTLERKTASELLGVIGGRLDTQLLKYLNSADRVSLLVEGMITPAVGGGCIAWHKNGSMFVPVSKWVRKKREPIVYKTHYVAVMAYLFSLQTNWGINVMWSGDMESSAQLIGSIVANSQKPTHTSLSPYNRDRRKKPQVADPLVETLMGIGGAKIGETTAKKILTHYPDPYHLYIEDKEVLEKILGKSLTTRILDGIGRRDV